jgi:hypothetical protein
VTSRHHERCCSRTKKVFSGGRTSRATGACESVSSWTRAAAARTVCRKSVNYTVGFVVVLAMVAHTVGGYRFVIGIPWVDYLQIHGGLLPVFFYTASR